MAAAGVEAVKKVLTSGISSSSAIWAGVGTAVLPAVALEGAVSAVAASAVVLEVVASGAVVLPGAGKKQPFFFTRILAI